MMTPQGGEKKRILKSPLGDLGVKKTRVEIFYDVASFTPKPPKGGLIIVIKLNASFVCELLTVVKLPTNKVLKVPLWGFRGKNWGSEM